MSCLGFFIIFLMAMPWIYIMKSFRQYYLVVSLPFEFVLQKGHTFYKKKWFSTLCTQGVNLMTMSIYYFFVMLMHWTQNIESLGKFQQLVLLLFPYVFRKVYYFYLNMLIINYANYLKMLMTFSVVCPYVYIMYTQTFAYHYLEMWTILKAKWRTNIALNSVDSDPYFL